MRRWRSEDRGGLVIKPQRAKDPRGALSARDKAAAPSSACGFSSVRDGRDRNALDDGRRRGRVGVGRGSEILTVGKREMIRWALMRKKV